MGQYTSWLDEDEVVERPTPWDDDKIDALADRIEGDLTKELHTRVATVVNNYATKVQQAHDAVDKKIMGSLKTNVYSNTGAVTGTVTISPVQPTPTVASVKKAMEDITKAFSGMSGSFPALYQDYSPVNLTKADYDRLQAKSKALDELVDLVSRAFVTAPVESMRDRAFWDAMLALSRKLDDMKLNRLI